MSVPYGEAEPGARLDFTDEALQRQLTQDCVAESLAYATVARTFDTSTPFQLDVALMGLAQATDDPEVANAIATDEFRLTALADMARCAADSLLERTVITQATDIFGDQEDVAPIVHIMNALGKPVLLSAITDTTSRQDATWRLAVHWEDTSLVSAIQDPERRLTALITIIKHTNRDIAPYLALIDSAKERQRAIATRALEKLDVDLTATICDVSQRVRALLDIAEKTEGKIIAAGLPQLIAEVSDTMPTQKAMYLKQYMDISESTEQATDLQAVAGRIEDPVTRAYFFTSVVARTGDAALVAEVEATLQTYGSGAVVLCEEFNICRAGQRVGRA